MSSLPSQKVILLIVAGFALGWVSGCPYRGGNDGAANSPANTTVPDNRASATPSPIPRGTLLPGNDTSPPRTLVETLRAEMLEASFGAARQQHPFSNFTGDGCVEISFALLETKGNRTQYIGLYRCTMKGKILGISTFNFQVDVLGEVRNENGVFSKGIVSAD
jgi:hypothetical protein